MPTFSESMETLANLDEAEAKVLADIRRFLSDLRGLTGATRSLAEGTKRLRRIRGAVYENLNQIQHEYLVLQGLRWLRQNGFADARLKWSWNPRQTGNATEPDLRATDRTRIVLSAEATTSEKPVGVIDSRMRDTLAKLSRMPGQQFYFVCSAAMTQRATTKVDRNSWRIQIVEL